MESSLQPAATYLSLSQRSTTVRDPRVPLRIARGQSFAAVARVRRGRVRRLRTVGGPVDDQTMAVIAVGVALNVLDAAAAVAVVFLALAAVGLERTFGVAVVAGDFEGCIAVAAGLVVAAAGAVVRAGKRRESERGEQRDVETHCGKVACGLKGVL